MEEFEQDAKTTNVSDEDEDVEELTLWQRILKRL